MRAVLREVLPLAAALGRLAVAEARAEQDLNLRVERGSRVLVTGGNGCGKSSLFRVIRKLWPLVSGTITMPDDEDIYFLTQVNFVPVGSLRDLVIYPWSHQDMRRNGRTDDDIYQCLAWAQCSPRPATADGRADLQFVVDGQVVRPELDDSRDWCKDLSPGQKQKLAFARLFFHRPAFVVLDECTNGISPDVEQSIYDRCTRMNLGIFSISHKIELKEVAPLPACAACTQPSLVSRQALPARTLANAALAHCERAACRARWRI